MSESESRNDDIGAIVEALGIAKPLSTKALAAIAQDPLYAHHLMIAKDHSVFLEHLLNNPPDVAITDQEIKEETVTSDYTILVQRAVAAIARWAGSGFTITPDDVFKRRISACLHCNHRRQHGRNEVSDDDVSDNEVCELCGCPIRRKAKMLSEKCPDRNRKQPNGKWEFNSL